jgi:hypothetical protein
MDFIGAAKPGYKPCFKTNQYVHKTSYFGSMIRWRDDEKQATIGNAKIREYCKEAAEAYDAYKETSYAQIILDRMLKMRNGLLEIRNTYADDINIYTDIDISIMILDVAIPEDTKIATGIMVPKKIE